MDSCSRRGTLSHIISISNLFSDPPSIFDPPLPLLNWCYSMNIRENFSDFCMGVLQVPKVLIFMVI